ncbi:MAG: DNA cytosine methyltransferase [Saprospiraceae bacterium]|nr:DNA cytosine methyltransferase [Saprospiraceae bacterium]
MTTYLKNAEPLMLVVDLFCGAGGVTTGIERARLHNRKLAKVIACVNHDPLAISSHQANHPGCFHFTEDIRSLKLDKLIEVVDTHKKQFPNARLILWASLECTNFSNAKGGLPRDADSRTLARDLFRYIEAIKPDGVWIENVKEFMSWGPLDEKGKPLSRKNGKDYVRWCNHMQTEFGFAFDWKLLNSADFGAHTSRTRYFAQFARNGLDIVWPQPTHSKAPKDGMFEPLKKWKPVREVLDLDEHGQSIFERKKPLVEKTLQRIYAGLLKYVAGGDDSFLQKYYSGKPEDKVQSLDLPNPALTTVPHESIVQACFIQKYNSNPTNGVSKGASLYKPCPTICAQVRLTLVHAQYMIQYNGKVNYSQHGLEKSCPTICTKDRLSVVTPTSQQWIHRQYSSGTPTADLNKPSDTLLATPKQILCTALYIDRSQEIIEDGQSVCKAYIIDTSYNNLPKSVESPLGVVTADRHWYYLVNPQYQSSGSSIDRPCFTLIARMDKAPPYLVSAEEGQAAILIYSADSPTMKKIKLFMAHYGMMDIKMRMLNIDELKRITGLPVSYQLHGPKSAKKKFIGNAVTPVIPEAMVMSHCQGILSQPLAFKAINAEL